MFTSFILIQATRCYATLSAKAADGTTSQANPTATAAKSVHGSLQRALDGACNCTNADIVQACVGDQSPWIYIRVLAFGLSPY